MFSDVQIDEDELNTKLQKKLLWILVLTGCVANMVGFLSNAVLFGMSLPTIVCGTCEIVVILCGVTGIGMGKQKVATAVMLLMFTLVEFPFLFYVYGANMGVYLVLGIVALAVYFPRPYHVLAIVVAILVDVTVILLFYFYPGSIEEMTIESQIGTMICSYVIVVTATAVMLCALIYQYTLQREQIVTISRKLEYAANRDALTGVYNRRYLIHTLNQWMSTEDKQFLVVLVDIDNFKEINDTYGHVYGDEVLVELARLMEENIGEKGIAARYGGEEFMALFEETDRERAVEIMNRINRGLGRYSMKTRKITITFSGGLVEYKTDGRLDELFRNADRKLYEAKNRGKNQVIF